MQEIDHIYPDLAYQFVSSRTSAEDTNHPKPTTNPIDTDDSREELLLDEHIEVKEEPIDQEVEDNNWMLEPDELPNLDDFIIQPHSSSVKFDEKLAKVELKLNEINRCSVNYLKVIKRNL
jgi:hypothetical protein